MQEIIPGKPQDCSNKVSCPAVPKATSGSGNRVSESDALAHYSRLLVVPLISGTYTAGFAFLSLLFDDHVARILPHEASTKFAIKAKGRRLQGSAGKLQD